MAKFRPVKPVMMAMMWIQMPALHPAESLSVVTESPVVIWDPKRGL
jgi:hypothetical protein